MKSTKSIFVISCIVIGLSISVSAQKQGDQNKDKREKRKNLVITEFVTIHSAKNRWMDRKTVYNEKGLKVEEIEYSTYGQKERSTYEYDSQDRCIKELVYDDRDKVMRVRKYEYDSDNTKRTQYNYLPNGRLYSTKVYEYSR